MSENLSILDGELRRQFAPVDRLSVDNQGGGVSPWVISDFLDISTLSVSENGLYLAAEEEYDCYEEVEVDISEELGEGDYRRITGKGQDGNDYAVSVDGDGNLTTEMIPAAIHIVVPPRKRKYEEGETLDFTGIHVYLMDGNNKRYTDDNYPTGEIPFGELIFPETIAHGSGSQYSIARYGDISIPFVTTTSFFIPDSLGRSEEDTTYTFYSTISSGVTVPVKAYAYSGFCFSYSTEHYLFHRINRNGSAPWSQQSTLAGVTTNSKQNIYRIIIGDIASYWDSDAIPLPPQFDHTGLTEQQIIDTLFDGDIESSDNNIPVQWMRSDGTILEDTFAIEIGESEEGEEQPDPWAGAADVSWNGHHYNLNRRIVPEVHYANGYLWQEGISTEYNVEQAASMGWLILIR